MRWRCDTGGFSKAEAEAVRGVISQSYSGGRWGDRGKHGLAKVDWCADVNSWYVGANIPGKARPFLTHLGPEGVGGCWRCDEVAARSYEGFQVGVAGVETRREQEAITWTPTMGFKLGTV